MVTPAMPIPAPPLHSKATRGCFILVCLVTLVATNTWMELGILKNVSLSASSENIVSRLITTMDQHETGKVPNNNLRNSEPAYTNMHPTTPLKPQTDEQEDTLKTMAMSSKNTKEATDKSDGFDDRVRATKWQPRISIDQNTINDPATHESDAAVETPTRTKASAIGVSVKNENQGQTQFLFNDPATHVETLPASPISKKQQQSFLNDPATHHERTEDGRTISSATYQQTSQLIEENSARNKKLGNIRDTTWTTNIQQNDDNDTPTATATKDLPWRVVWLMSFPNSGTTFTLKFTQTSTNTSTATNYGAIEQDCCNTTIPVHPSYDNGPYWRHPFNPKPTTTNLILTKTHCGADDPDVMSLDHDIERHCRLSSKRIDGKVISGHHPRELVAKAVRLIRNPYDNIVARMHYRQRIMVQSKDVEHRALGATFNSTYTGFQNWCRWVDQHAVESKKQQWLDNFPDVQQWTDLLKPAPCHTEFVRWLWWHERIVQMLDEVVPVPVLNLYYENYSKDFSATTTALLDFIEMEITHKPLDFIAGKTYPEFYDDEQVVSIRKLIQTLASPKVWGLIQHYFE